MNGSGQQVSRMFTVVALAFAISSCDAGSFVDPPVAEPNDAVALEIVGLAGLVVEDDTVPVAAHVLDEDGRALTVDGLEWTSSDPSVASVQSSGGSDALLTASKPGTTTVSVSYESLRTSVEVEVHNRPVDLVYISGSGQSAPGGSKLDEKLVVFAVDRRGDPVSGVSVKFQVTAGGGVVAPTVMLTEGNGQASAEWTLGESGAQEVRAVADPNQPRVKNMKDSVVVFTATAVVPVSSLNVTPDTATVAEGDSLQLSVSATTNNGNNIGDPGVSWESSDTSVASISKKGVLRGRKGGKTFAIARYSSSDRTVSDSSEVTVKAETRTITAVAIDPTSVTTNPGASVDFDVTGTLSDGSQVGVSVTWSATGGSIDSDGLFTAGSQAGTFRVIATHAQGPADTAEVSIVEPAPQVTRVTVSPETTTLNVGTTAQLTAQAFDGSGTELTDVTFAWTSTDQGIATVSSSGLVTAKAVGSALVIAAAAGVADTASVTIESVSSIPTTPGSGIWIGPEQISQLPTSGVAWDAVLADAERDFGIADISDQDSKHDNYTLAAALVCARTGEYCAKAENAIIDAIGTEGGRWLAVSRNLASYVIAADILRSAVGNNITIDDWIRSWPTKQIPDNITGDPRTFSPFHSGSNAATHEGFAHAAVASYLGDDEALNHVWEAYRTFVCDPGAPDPENINLGAAIEYNWVHDERAPCAINPKGTVKTVPSGLPGAGTTHRLDGSIGNDMRRGGPFQWEPGYTQYPWTGLAGLVPAAVVLHRAGYPAFEIADRAIARTHEYLWHLRTQTGNVAWFDADRGSEVVQLVNFFYGTSYPADHPVSDGHTISYTDWTHSR